MRTGAEGNPAVAPVQLLGYPSGPGRWLVVAAALGSGVCPRHIHPLPAVDHAGRAVPAPEEDERR
jgi:hypothetical protein